MIPMRETISSFAQVAIADGDDLHISGSIDEDEENYSVIGNASHHTRSIAKLISDDVQNVDERGKTVHSMKNMKVVKILRQLGEKSKLLPKQIRQQSSKFLPYISTVAEYQEMFDEEEVNENHTNDSDTAVSNRSSRNNVTTGKTMLVKQRAQVVNRPSSSQGRWNSSQSPRSESRSYKNLMLRQKSLILDDSSVGGISDITEDTSFLGSSKMDHELSFRRTPMFINADTYRIEEDEDESESESEPNDKKALSDRIRKRGHNFSGLSPLNDEISSLRQSAFGTHSTNKVGKEPSRSHSVMGHMNLNARRRVHSDSDVSSKCQRGITKTSSSTNDLFATPRSGAEIDSWPFPRTKKNFTRLDKFSCQDPIESKQTDSFQPSRRSSLPMFQSGNSDHDQRSRTYSDSAVHKKSGREQLEISWEPPKIGRLKREPGEGVSTTKMRDTLCALQHNENSNASQEHRLTSTLIDNKRQTKSTKTLSDEPSPNCRPTSSVLAILSPTNCCVEGALIYTEKRVPLQGPFVRNPSPRMSNAASALASPLRPGPAQNLPTLPAQSPSAMARLKSDKYYWGDSDTDVVIESSNLRGSEIHQQTELRDLCSWSSESFDDIF